MPELPEVETIVNDLKKELPGLTVRQFSLLNQRQGLRNSVINYQIGDFRKLIEKKLINSIERRAKNIVLRLNDGVIAIHLKMTGQMIYENQAKHEVLVGGHPILGAGRELPGKFCRAVFEFSDGSKLYFNDVRRFGWIRFYANDEWQLESAKSGIEPLSGDFTLAAFRSIISRRSKTAIKQVIMDAKFMVGVGNIYADEALFAAGIRPSRTAGCLSEPEIKNLWQNIPKILRRSIRHRGTSFNDYVDARGAQGNFVKLLQVYGRGGKPCPVCRRELIKTKIGGRGTVYCGHCQR